MKVAASNRTVAATLKVAMKIFVRKLPRMAVRGCPPEYRPPGGLVRGAPGQYTNVAPLSRLHRCDDAAICSTKATSGAGGNVRRARDGGEEVPSGCGVPGARCGVRVLGAAGRVFLVLALLMCTATCGGRADVASTSGEPARL